MVKGDVVEAVLARLAAGETVSAVAAAYDLDRKTVRAWRARGAYRLRAPRERAKLLAPHAAWLTGRAPEVDFNSEVLARELRTHFGNTGTVQTVLRFIRPQRLAAQRPVATVRFETPPGQQAQVDFGQRRVLIGGDWIRQHHTVLITGPTGTGKTWFACALGNSACRQGNSVRYVRVPRLLEEDLVLASADRSYAKLMHILVRTDLLILDDWGLAPLGDRERRDLLELVEDRFGRRATLVTSKIPVDHWHEMIGDPTFSDAILDRLVHHAHRLTLSGRSLRRLPTPDAPSD